MDLIFKEGSFVRNLIEHHTKYIETHGVDETVWITISDHHKIDHRKLFPMVTAKELALISARAWRRTQKAKDEHYSTPSDGEMKDAVQNKRII